METLTFTRKDMDPVLNRFFQLNRSNLDQMLATLKEHHAELPPEIHSKLDKLYWSMVAASLDLQHDYLILTKQWGNK